MEISAYVYEVRYEGMFASDLTRRIKKALLEKGLISKGLEMEVVDERIQSTLADNLVDLGKRFAQRNSAGSRRMSG